MFSFFRKKVDNEFIYVFNMVNIWWFMHSEETGILVIHNARNYDFSGAVCHLINDQDQTWTLEVPLVLPEMAEKYYFADELNNKGLPFQGRLHKIIIERGNKRQIFRVKGNEIFKDEPE